DRRCTELVAGRCRERLTARLHVGTGAKRAAGARDDHGAHGIVGVAGGVGAAELLAHPTRERVELVGSVERDYGDAVGGLDGDELAAPHGSGARRARWPSKSARSAGRAATASPTRSTSGTRPSSAKQRSSFGRPWVRITTVSTGMVSTASDSVSMTVTSW